MLFLSLLKSMGYRAGLSSNPRRSFTLVRMCRPTLSWPHTRRDSRRSKKRLTGVSLEADDVQEAVEAKGLDMSQGPMEIMECLRSAEGPMGGLYVTGPGVLRCWRHTPPNAHRNPVILIHSCCGECRNTNLTRSSIPDKKKTTHCCLISAKIKYQQSFCRHSKWEEEYVLAINQLRSDDPFCVFEPTTLLWPRITSLKAAGCLETRSTVLTTSLDSEELIVISIKMSTQSQCLCKSQHVENCERIWESSTHSSVCEMDKS